MCAHIHLEEKMTTSRLAIAILTAVMTMYPAVQPVDAQAPGSAMKPVMTAKLIDAEKKASGRAATVEVTTSGVELVDPAISMEKAVPGQGHLHYQVDKGPIIATPSAKLSFHELGPGAHTILVVLAGNDHKPLGPQQQLNVTVPAQPQKASY
jgi:lipoprotein-anchoring transpeptidase ErfK/SrfK